MVKENQGLKNQIQELQNQSQYLSTTADHRHQQSNEWVNEVVSFTKKSEFNLNTILNSTSADEVVEANSNGSLVAPQPQTAEGYLINRLFQILIFCSGN